jgi:2-dehydro-3-deoxygluconokinase
LSTTIGVVANALNVRDTVTKNMEYDVIGLGETMLALAPAGGLHLADAPSLLVDHAGAESNTCVGLARLGLAVAWISRVGSDAAGDRILRALGGEGIDVRWVERDPHRSTGLMLKEPGVGVRYYRTESAASVMGPALLDSVPVAAARAVLVTGVTALIGALPHAAGLALLDRARHLRIVDPNLRAGLWGSNRRAELVRPFVERANLLLTSVDELEEILGAGRAGEAGGGRGTGGENRDDGAEALARTAAAIGPREVVIRGAATIGALVDGAWRTLEIRRGAVVDPIGAGDAFNAGYIATRLRGGSVDEALRAGVSCGTAVTTAVSDTAGFPRTRP